MDDAFLAEQLERMRRLAERMSQAHERVAENSELISRERDRLHSTPLQDVRDLRPLQTQDYQRHTHPAARAPQRHDRVRAAERSPALRQRHTAADAPRRKRRR